MWTACLEEIYQTVGRQCYRTKIWNLIRASASDKLSLSLFVHIHVSLFLCQIERVATVFPTEHACHYFSGHDTVVPTTMVVGAGPKSKEPCGGSISVVKKSSNKTKAF